MDLILRTGQVHDSVHNQRRGLKLLFLPGLEQPLDMQAIHVLRVDLVEPAESPAIVGA